MEIGLAFVFVVLVVLAMLSVSNSWHEPQAASRSEPEQPVMVDLNLLTLKAESTMAAVEGTLKARQLHHEAEGARQTRAAVKALLEATKHEHR